MICKYCTKEHDNEGTGLCNGCWELKKRVEAQPVLAMALARDLVGPNTINTNECVWIKLNECGRELIRATEHRTVPAEDSNGWSMWQIHDLMYTLGPLCQIGLNTGFETDILLVGPDAK